MSFTDDATNYRNRHKKKPLVVIEGKGMGFSRTRKKLGGRTYSVDIRVGNSDFHDPRAALIKRIHEHVEREASVQPVRSVSPSCVDATQPCQIKTSQARFVTNKEARIRMKRTRPGQRYSREIILGRFRWAYVYDDKTIVQSWEPGTGWRTSTLEKTT